MAANLYTVLIIDDDEDIRSVLSDILEEFGFIVFEAASAEEAFTVADRITPNIIILDVMLGGMTGWGVIKLLRASVNTVKVPVVMISGSEEAAEDFALLAPSKAAFLAKPFHAHELLGKIAGFLGIDAVTQHTGSAAPAQAAIN